MKELSVLTTTDFIATKILFLRGEKVLLDADLALLYGVETRVLKQAVRRNIDRFPDDFMFQLTPDEFTNLRSQFVTSSWVVSAILPSLSPSKAWPCSAASSTAREQ